ncbi:SGNH/GDSL hydrolase family protein [Homoserinibacter sp. YIM 151385]|uniref:SGNH/GDSL hydrolase family protein n=1 Tax=Homoserinibacter sp. YIM 151385 TaxID=2985506 RepID=UPI0022F01253|nr:SGNH/GDSL hydrolase family protein [Homoserinibacter sp. YIM 151385]WBU36877.1 SGNH/GDSL hydrolase family protein [Homoserinibacter sp. YIM 151385]
MRSRVALAAALLGAAVVLAGCAPASSDPEGPVTDPDAPLAAFYGDSYTLGTGASEESRRWSTIISTERGWREFNPSVNGLGFVNNRGTLDLPAAVIRQDPDLLFITMGLNDNFSYRFGPEAIEAQIDADLERLRDELPESRIIVVEPFWYTDERPESVAAIIGWVRDAAAAIDAEYIPGASRWIEGHPEWMAADGLHPNDEGYAEMAARMDAELRKLGL